MTPPTPPTPPVRTTPPDDDHNTPPRDALDGMLREWHTVNADRARAGRDRLMQSLAAEPARSSEPTTKAAHVAGSPLRPVIHVIRRTFMNRYSPMAAAALIAMALLVSMLIPATTPPVYAGGTIMCSEGGRLDAVDADGNILGPCELTRTDVDVRISGFLTRVTLRQQFRNPHPDKIEAVYTFPMSHRSAVDKMTMTIGDRVIVGEVKEREAARQIYESARAQGRIASLLEQERPNIFTQSVANIEPGAAIDIEISYVEVLEQSEGRYTFSFPTVVGPRYIPGAASASEGLPLPPELTPRRGLVLLAPATATPGRLSHGAKRNAPTAKRLTTLLASARPVERPPNAGTGARPEMSPWLDFVVTYPDGSSETGVIDSGGLGHVNWRWFWTDPDAAADRSARGADGLAPNTDQVPDASKITPMSVRPPMRAGHDIGITVTIDTGGPPIAEIAAPLHEVVRRDEPTGADEDHTGVSRTRITLKEQSEIPNRDFVLSWSLAGEKLQESIFTHNGQHGGFFSLILQPPARVSPEMAVPRELIFVLDTSGSMRGHPIEKAKAVMSRAIDAMRDRDTFNMITFSGDTRILWDKPRPNTAENRAEAQKFLASRHGGGGTEMMRAIEAALRQAPDDDEPRVEAITLADLANLPADGRMVTVELPWDAITGEPDGAGLHAVQVREGLSIRIGIIPPAQGSIMCPVGESVLVTGAWVTEGGERVLRPTAARWKNAEGLGIRPLRLVTFFTDGYVGNDMAIIDAIRKHRATTRVFSFGIGNSVNRYLLDGMARAGAGEADYVLLADEADPVVERFTRRISTPLLANINVRFSDGLRVLDVLPSAEDGGIPDLFDLKPLVIHGRFAAPGSGTVTITGTTGAGPYTRTIDLDLPAAEPANNTIATLWAREKVGSIMNRDLEAAQRGTFPAALRQEVVTLGETFSIMTQYTSFVAVDKLRVTIGGEPRLVSIPIEMADGVSWEGVFGEDVAPGQFGDIRDLLPRDANWIRLGLEGDATTRDHAVGKMQDERFSAARSIRGVREERLGHFMKPGGSPTVSGRSLAVTGTTFTIEENAVRAPYTVAGLPVAPASSAAPGVTSLDSAVMREELERAEALMGFGEATRRRSNGPARGRDLAGGVVGARETAGASADDAEALNEGRLPSVQVGQWPEDAALPLSDAELLHREVEASPYFQALTAKLGHFRGPAPRLPAELGIVRLAELAAEGKLDDARALAAAMVGAVPDFEPAARAQVALGEEPAERARALNLERDQAKATIEDAIRALRLRRTLDADLLPFAMRNDLPPTLDLTYTGDKPIGVQWKDGGVLVTILVKSTDDAAAFRLRALGINIEHTSPATSVFVAVVPLGRLSELALLDGVRRVEPTRLSAP